MRPINAFVIVFCTLGEVSALASGNIIIENVIVPTSQHPVPNTTDVFTFVRDYNASPFGLYHMTFDYQIAAPAGQHWIKQEPATGYTLVDIACVLSQGATSLVTFSNSPSAGTVHTTWQAGDSTVNILLAENDTVECQFTSQKIELASCGNGILEIGETCDPGILNPSDPDYRANCRQNCSYCGDRIVQKSDGENCEPSLDQGCDPQCKLASGIRVVKVFEGCGSACSAQATFVPSYGAPFTLSNGSLDFSGYISAGNYSVTESDINGWLLNRISCDCLSSSINSGGTFRACTSTETNIIENNKLVGTSIMLGSAELVRCTFYNKSSDIPPPPPPPSGTCQNKGNCVSQIAAGPPWANACSTDQQDKGKFTRCHISSNDGSQGGQTICADPLSATEGHNGFDYAGPCSNDVQCVDGSCRLVITGANSTNAVSSISNARPISAATNSAALSPGGCSTTGEKSSFALMPLFALSLMLFLFRRKAKRPHQ